MDIDYNIKFYALCRHKLNILQSNIFNEIKDLFSDQLVPSETKLVEWLNEYNTHSEPNELIDSVFMNDTLDYISQPEPKIVKKMKFYSICRFHLNLNENMIIEELNNIFNTTKISSKFKTWLSKQKTQEIKFKSVLITRKCVDLTDYIVGVEKTMKLKCDHLEFKLDEMNHKYEEELSINASLRNELNNLKHFIDENKCEDIQNNQEEINSTSDTNSERNEFISFLKKINLNYKQKIKNYEYKLADLNQLIKETYEVNLNKQANEIKVLKNDIQRTQQELLDLTFENSELKRSQPNLNYKKEVELLKAINLENQRQIFGLNEDNIRLNEEINKLESKLGQCLKERESQLKMFNEKIYKQITDKNGIKTKSNHQKEELKRINMAVVKYKQRCCELEIELNKQKEMILKEKRIQEIKKDLEEKLESFKENTKAVKETQTDCNDTKELERLNGEIERLNGKLEAKTREMKQFIEKSTKSIQANEECKNNDIDSDCDIIIIEESCTDNKTKRKNELDECEYKRLKTELF